MAEDVRCRKKDDDGTVTISDTLVKRLLTDEDTAKVQQAKESDEEWMKKLKSMDEYHTNQCGLTMANFDKVLLSVQREIALATKEFAPCHDRVRDVIQCYRDYSTRTLNCCRQVQKFVKCVDEKKREMETLARNKNKMSEITSDCVN